MDDKTKIVVVENDSTNLTRKVIESSQVHDNMITTSISNNTELVARKSVGKNLISDVKIITPEDLAYVELLSLSKIFSMRSKSTQKSTEYVEKANKLREIKRVNYCILKNICPTGDGGKLIRSKKNKKDGHRRHWTCAVCGENFYMF